MSNVLWSKMPDFLSTKISILTKEVMLDSDNTQGTAGTASVDAATATVESATPMVSLTASVNTSSSSGSVAPSADTPVGTVATADSSAPAVTLESKLVNAELAVLGIDKFSQECQDLITTILASSTIAQGTMREVMTYVVDMDPSRAQTETSGGMSQIKLYRAIQYVCDQAPSDFQLFFATFLRIIYESRAANGAFYPQYLFRFMPSVNLGPDDRRAFQNLMHVFGTLCDTTTRAQAIKQIDFNQAFKLGLSDAGRQRLISFFAI